MRENVFYRALNFHVKVLLSSNRGEANKSCGNIFFVAFLQLTRIIAGTSVFPRFFPVLNEIVLSV